MKIHLVTDEFMVGGGIEHIYQIVKGIKKINFGVFGKPGVAEGKFTDLPNVKVYNRGYNPGYVMSGKPDLVHVHHFRSFFSLYKTPFSAYKIPVIFTAHGMHIHKYEFSRTLNSKIKYSLRFNLEKRILKKADAVIAVSMEDKEFMEKNYNLKNVLYLTNGIDFTKVRSTFDKKKDLRNRLNLPRENFLFVTVARFNFQKGYDILIKTISSIRDFAREKNVKFVFVGTGEEFEKMKLLSQELSVDDLIVFLGERHDVFDILKACDVFLLTSRWEGLPIVLIETGVLEIPVVASDTYGNREILKGGRGILFKNEDIKELSSVIKKVVEGKYDLKKYTEKLHQEVHENYNLEKMISGLKFIYKDVLT